MADSYIGEIRIFTGNYAPYGWALCNGQILPIVQNAALYSILGVQFGGDGKTTFALPNLNDKVPLHQGTGPGLTPRAFAATGGEANVTITANQIPAHTHIPKNQSTPNTVSPQGSVWSNTDSRKGTNVYSAANIDVEMNPFAIQPAGGSQSHNNMQPYLGLNFIISLEGEYPPKP